MADKTTADDVFVAGSLLHPLSPKFDVRLFRKTIVKRLGDVLPTGTTPEIGVEYQVAEAGFVVVSLAGRPGGTINLHAFAATLDGGGGFKTFVYAMQGASATLPVHVGETFMWWGSGEVDVETFVRFHPFPVG